MLLFAAGPKPPQIGDIGYGGVVFFVDDYVHVAALNYGPKVQLANFTGYVGLGNIIQTPEQGQNLINSSINDEYYLSSVYSYNQIYPSASLYLSSLNIDGYTGWYMPTIYELELIRETFIYIEHNLVEESTEVVFHSANKESSYANSPFYRCSNCFSELPIPQIYLGTNYHLLNTLPVRSFPIIYGCTDELALNYDTLATVNDSTCEYQYQLDILNLEDSINSTLELLQTLNVELDSHINQTINSVSVLEQALETWNTTISLNQGWNMFGYNCPDSVNVIDVVTNYVNDIIIIKDNNGVIYMPEFDFNGIGKFVPGFGYQIKLQESIDDFNLCNWYVNNIPEDNILSLQEENLQLQFELDSLMSLGCVDSIACNYDPLKQYDDGSCEYPESGYDCDGNSNVQVGDIAFGGIVFYLDDTGQHGLVAALEDLPSSFSWGCNYQDIQGANGTSIGLGKSNTNFIVDQCSGSSAALYATQYEAYDYNDWYLPSTSELILLEQVISNINGLDNSTYLIQATWANLDPFYWSSSTSYANTVSLGVEFPQGYAVSYNRTSGGYIRVIRSF